MGLVNIAKLDVKDNSANKFFNMIEHQIEFLDHVLKDLAAIKSVEEEGASHELIDFESLLMKFKSEFKDSLKLNNIKFNCHVTLNTPFYSDKKLINLILYHLIENSLMFYDAQKPQPYVEVNIKLVKNHDLLNISVTDNGVGVGEDIKPHIFKMFYRGNEKSKGSGLGLYIVKNAVEKLSGNCRFTSEATKGSVFSIDLPVLK